jgi:hypothetical protein
MVRFAVLQPHLIRINIFFIAFDIDQCRQLFTFAILDKISLIRAFNNGDVRRRFV